MTNKIIINTTLDNYYNDPIKIKIINNNFINNDIYIKNSVNLDNYKFNKKNFNPLLFKLIANNQKDKLNLILKNNQNNLDINIQDKDGDTPLHIAIFLCNLDIIKILIKYGADTKIKDKWGQTPVHRLYFCINDNQILKIIDLLYKNNVNFNEIDNFGNTVLHLALKQIIKLEIKLTENHYKFINKLKSLISNEIKNNEKISIEDLLNMINYN
jgi:ankyrin repeat protein